jgi:hypothetical protein
MFLILPDKDINVLNFRLFEVQIDQVTEKQPGYFPV